MKYQLLAIDVDGTLVDRSERLSPAIRAALRRAVAAGVHVVLATGRRYGRVLHLVEPLSIELPLITACGGLIKDPRDHQTLFRAEYDEAALGALLDFLFAEGHSPILSGDTYTEGYEFCYRQRHADRPEVAEFLERNAARCRLWDGPIDVFPPKLHAGLVLGAEPEMHSLESQIHQRWNGAFTTYVLPSPRTAGFLCEFMPAGTTKWAAIERLAAAWRVSHESICAVGDDINDVPMIRSAGLGVAMGNAPEPVKAVADRIAPSHAEDGVATVIEWILE